MQFIRSFIFSVSMIIATVLVSLVLLLCVPLPFPLRSRVGRAYAAYVIGTLKVLCGVDYQVKGRENIPEGAALSFPNTSPPGKPTHCNCCFLRRCGC